MTLACGHEPSPHSNISVSTGTAHLPDGREVCWECADAWQRDQMRASDRLDAYLTGDGATIATWSGGKLAHVTSKVTARRVYLRAIDDTGKRWHGTSPGPGMYARMRATRGVS